MASSVPQNVHVSSHPCVRAKLSQLRSSSTSARETKQLVHDIALMVGYEALARGLSTESAGTDTSPIGYTYTTDKISPTNVSIVPILRSGLSMVEPLLTLLPEPVPVFHLGMYREKSTLQPVEYYNNLPYHNSSSPTGTSGGPSDLAILVDPIIATGATASAAIDTLKDWGVKRILVVSVLGSVGGLERASSTWAEGTEFWVGGVDQETDAKGMIKPGLGDVGDRLFGTLGK
ncbi:uracil phosphoribosyltransferase [Myriangium duriaei CBS 260.36]|uniref:uracil phosphoribosyltransferase n=1 Tax=Myriangium duriaei CBS 260.36 TaxID=1168546 RepID=A0A9P4MBS0_9PEZI|nr:uracil phosphoribosyltransferase [Myriangium duriaei CBS 260.36]